MAFKINSLQDLLIKARNCKVKDLPDDGWYDVTSPRAGDIYRVDLNEYACTCPRQDWVTEANGYINACSHVQAALIFDCLKVNYWLVARAADEDVSHLHRKAIDLIRYFGGMAKFINGDGVKFTAREITAKAAQAKLVAMSA